MGEAGVSAAHSEVVALMPLAFVLPRQETDTNLLNPPAMPMSANAVAQRHLLCTNLPLRSVVISSSSNGNAK
jgi:hypothetical protein